MISSEIRLVEEEEEEDEEEEEEEVVAVVVVVGWWEVSMFPLGFGMTYLLISSEIR